MAMTYHTTGHKTRQHQVVIKRVISEKRYKGRLYRLLDVETDGVRYITIRLHNAKNHFIKQFLFEPALISWLLSSLEGETDDLHRI
jgi:hypothetical protein